jgi:hypothetical protein
VTPEEEPSGLAKRLTLPGRVLLVVTVVGSVGGLAAWFLFTWDPPRPGSHPILVWCVPVGIVSVFFFFGAALLLEKCGVPVFRKPPGEPR